MHLLALIFALIFSTTTLESITINSYSVTQSEFKEASQLTLSENGIALIKKYEGLRLVAYLDTTGTITVGYGSTGYYADTGVKIKLGDVITEERAIKIFMVDLERTYIKDVRENVKVKITQNMFDSLISFTYNLGEGNLRNICENINVGDFIGASKRMLLYDKAYNPKTGKKEPLKGLTKRRTEESELFMK